MSHDPRSGDMQDYDDDHIDESFKNCQDIVKTFGKRIEDSDDSIDYQIILKAMAQAVMDSANDLEQIYMLAEESFQKRYDTRRRQELHGRLDFIDGILSSALRADKILREARAAVQLKAQPSRVEDGWYNTSCGPKVMLLIGFSVGIISVMWNAGVIMMCYRHLSGYDQVNSLICGCILVTLLFLCAVEYEIFGPH